MLKNDHQFQLQVSFIKEGSKFIAFAPALDISTSGDTLDEAKKRFEEISALFLEECVRMGTLGEVLIGLGWQKKVIANEWVPPMVIGQESHQVHIHL